MTCPDSLSIIPLLTQEGFAEAVPRVHVNHQDFNRNDRTYVQWIPNGNLQRERYPSIGAD